MKKRIVAGTSDVLLSSEMFDLVKRTGVGGQDTPYTMYEVSSKGLADDYVVEIRLRTDYPYLDGEPVEFTVRESYIRWGISSNSGKDVDEFIKVLQAAKEFKAEIDKYFGL